VLRIVLEGSRDPALEQRRARAGFSFVLERVLINAQIAVPLQRADRSATSVVQKIALTAIVDQAYNSN